MSESVFVVVDGATQPVAVFSTEKGAANYIVDRGKISDWDVIEFTLDEEPYA